MSHHSGDSVHDDDSDSSDSDGSKLSSVREHGEDNQSMIGVKFSKMFVDDSGKRSSFTGKVMSRTKVGGEWLHKVLYNDGDSEELTRKELVDHMNGVNHSDSESECDESDDSDDDSDYADKT